MTQALSVSENSVYDPTANVYYVPRHQLHEILQVEAHKHSVMTWHMGNKLRALRFGPRSNPTFKCAWTKTDVLAEFIERLYSLGFKKPKPGSWVYPFIQAWQFPKPRRATVYMLDKHPKGKRARKPMAWLEALQEGRLEGTWRQYDINNAYAWAASIGLPSPRSRCATNKVTPSDGGGIYLCTVRKWGAHPLPKHLRNADRRPVWATDEELWQCDAHGVTVLYGMIWRESYCLNRSLDWIDQSFSDYQAHKILQRFWGPWLGKRGVVQSVWKGGERTSSHALRSRGYSPVWGLTLNSRVALRVHEYAADASHVFADSVTLPYEIKTGSSPGEWKLQGEMTDHWVARTGLWGSEDKPRKHTGLSEDEARKRYEDLSYRWGATTAGPRRWRGLGLSDAYNAIIPAASRKEASEEKQTGSGSDGGQGSLPGISESVN